MNGNYKEFIDFLKYVGLITQKTEEAFKKSSNSYKNKKGNDIYSLLSDILEKYLNLLSNNEKSSIAKTIVSKYKENKKNLIHNILLKLIKNKERKYYFLYFNKWLKNIPFIKENEKSKQNKSEIMDNNYQNNSSLNHLENSTIDLINRQQQYMKKYKENKMNYINANEKLNNELCPFTPIIYTKNSKNEKKFLQNSERNPYKRLYDDLEKRQNKHNKILQDNMSLIKSNSVFKSKNPINSKMKKMKSKERIYQLYYDYKKRKNKKNLLQKEIDNERGLTFSPFFINRPKSSKSSSTKIKTVENIGNNKKNNQTYNQNLTEV